MNYSLVINAGSATYKYAVFQGRKKIISYLYQREGGKKFSFQKNGIPKEYISKQQFEHSLLDLRKREKNIFSNIKQIAFRVVHGGSVFSKPTLVTKQTVKKLEKLNSLAPLHNPYAVQLIKQSQRLYSNTKKIAVFDTSFHVDLPLENKTYALPKEFIKKHGVRRYGFHGIICSSIVHQMGWRLSKRAILCHLGSGCSVTAVLNGKSIDTSMGFTPLEGLMMGSRAGDIDPGLMLELEKKYDAKKLSDMLHHQSGLTAIAGIGDMREILKKAEKNNKSANLAIDMFCKKAAKYIAAYNVSLGGLNQLIFSGGIGENVPLIRQKICEYLHPFGVTIHLKKNQTAKAGQEFQKRFSKIKLSYLHADEASEMNRILQDDWKN